VDGAQKVRLSVRLLWSATASVVVASASAIGGGSYLDLKQREWIFRPQRELHATPADYGLRHEDVWLAIPSAQDTSRERVHGWWIPGPNAQAPTLLFLHGARWNLSNNLLRIQRLQRMGFSVLAIDYRGFGKSDGRLPSEEWACADAQAAWDHLRLLEPDPRRRFVYGHSLGGAIAIDLAARNSDVAGVIVESSFTSIREMAAALGYGGLAIGPLLTQHFDSLAKVGKVAAPMLFVHGTGDRFVPHSMSEQLFAAAQAPKRLLLVPNGGHGNVSAFAFEQYHSAVRDLVTLAGRTAAVVRDATVQSGKTTLDAKSGDGPRARSRFPAGGVPGTGLSRS
jgi:pimeloyl-ACP methyl ester carboxylesterase